MADFLTSDSSCPSIGRFIEEGGKMSDAAVSAFLGMLLSRLGIIQRMIAPSALRWWKRVREELDHLDSTLYVTWDVLEDAEERQVKERALTFWLKKLKDVAYDIDDVLDEAAVAALEHNPQPEQFKGKEMVCKFISFPKSLQFRHEIAKKIKKVNKRLQSIDIERSALKLKVKLHYSERETGSYVDASQVYGRDEDKRRIIDFLLSGCNEKNLGVISIVGPGGIGKTSLAKLVYNDDEQVSKHYETRIWVYVSKKFEIKNVIRSIIESLTKKELKFPSTETELMEQELVELIVRKRFLLVLDDVWDEYEFDKQWDSLGPLLNNGAKGSKVMVTTRFQQVASVMKSDQLHSLGGLPDDDCWKLFENNAFESGVSENNRILAAIGKQIVKKCEGLPLAIKALGSVLRFKTEESQWLAIMDNDIWTQLKDDKEILPALVLSYNRLSPSLKQCFAYCSIFPKGTQIQIKMLVELWVAEGLVTNATYGSQFVDQLLFRFLLENAIKDGFVVMHDMVHNLAQFVAHDECCIIDATSGSSPSISQNSRYASLILNEVTSSIAHILSSGQKLRTFHLIRSMEGEVSQEEHDICQNVLDTIFSNMRLLRALHLSNLSIKELPTTMRKLIHLRYLDLSYTELKDLPCTIGLLHNLQALKLQHSNLQTLPKSIGDLENLVTLDISYCESFHSLPDTIGKLICLQYLYLSSTEIQRLPSTIGTLHNLGTLDLSFCEKLEGLPESFGDLANLSDLILKGCWSLHSLPDTIGKLARLLYLDLSWTNLRSFPPTIRTLHNLRTLMLSNCEELEVLPESIGELANLLTVDLNGCKSFHFLPYHIGKLLHLQYLDLSWTKLKTLPPTIGPLQNLKTLRLSYCEELEMLLDSIGGLVNLLTLDLNSCESFHSLPNTIGKLVRMQYLDLSWTKLHTLPLTIGDLHNLQTLRLCNCEKLELLPESIGGLTNLLTLDLSGCKSLRSLPDTIGKLFHLQYLDLSSTKLQTLPPTIGTLHNLQKLQFRAC